MCVLLGLNSLLRPVWVSMNHAAVDSLPKRQVSRPGVYRNDRQVLALRQRAPRPLLAIKASGLHKVDQMAGRSGDATTLRAMSGCRPRQGNGNQKPGKAHATAGFVNANKAVQDLTFQDIPHNDQ